MKIIQYVICLQNQYGIVLKVVHGPESPRPSDESFLALCKVRQWWQQGDVITIQPQFGPDLFVQ